MLIGHTLFIEQVKCYLFFRIFFALYTQQVVRLQMTHFSISGGGDAFVLSISFSSNISVNFTQCHHIFPYVCLIWLHQIILSFYQYGFWESWPIILLRTMRLSSIIHGASLTLQIKACSISMANTQQISCGGFDTNQCRNSHYKR